MIKVKQKENETRKDYLVRVAIKMLRRVGDYWEMLERSGDYTSVVGVTSAFACYLKIVIISGLHKFLGNKNRKIIYRNIWIIKRDLLT